MVLAEAEIPAVGVRIDLLFPRQAIQPALEKLRVAAFSIFISLAGTLKISPKPRRRISLLPFTPHIPRPDAPLGPPGI
jgi:hypothetical protein